MIPPYLLRREQHKIGKVGRKSEKRLTREMGGRARPASGATQGAKGDIEIGPVLLEAKSTTSESLTLKRAWLDKIAREARSEAKTPALVVSFVNADGSAKTDGEWVLIQRHRFEELML